MSAPTWADAASAAVFLAGMFAGIYRETR